MSDQHRAKVQHTLLLIKPDGMEKGLEAPIRGTIEAAGLQITHEKYLQPDRSLLEAHYNFGEQWKKSVGEANLALCQQYHIDPLAHFGSSDPVEIGEAIRQSLIDYMLSRPIKGFVVSGENAVQTVRALCGATVPAKASPESIRGKYSSDTGDAAFLEKRSIKNIVHSSGNSEEAEHELKLWFPELYGFNHNLHLEP